MNIISKNMIKSNAVAKMCKINKLRHAQHVSKIRASVIVPILLLRETLNRANIGWKMGF